MTKTFNCILPQNWIFLHFDYIKFAHNGRSHGNETPLNITNVSQNNVLSYLQETLISRSRDSEKKPFENWHFLKKKTGFHTFK